MTSFIAACKELLFPAFCLACGRQLSSWRLPLLCGDCGAEVSFIRPPLCSCCGLPFNCGPDHFCGDCLAQTFAFDRARAALLYREPTISLIHSLKFAGQLTGLATMAALARDAAGYRDLAVPDLILPVPLHPQRLRERGFNQALLLGRACFPEQSRIINVDLLVRRRATLPQTRLSGKERRQNLAAAFTVTRPGSVKNKKILLIDDVFTTGSTVHECAVTLRRAGAARIEIFTIARAS